MREQGQVRFAGIAGYCISIPVLQFVAVPVFMIGNDPENYAFINFESLLVAGALLGLCSGLLLLALYRGLAAWWNSGIAIASLRFLFWWVLLAGFLLPVSVSAGMIDAQVVDTHLWHLVLTALIASGLTWLCRTEAKRYVLVFALVFSLFTVATSVFTISQSGAWRPPVTATEDIHESMQLSTDQNVLVISLDGLQGHVVADLLRDNPETADLFRDFTLFENVISQSPATEASIVGELFGIRDYKALGSSLEDVIAELEQRGLVSEIPLLRFEDAYQRGYLLGKGMQIPLNDLIFTADSVEFLKFALVRVATRYVVDNRVSNYVFGKLIDLLSRGGSDDLARRLRDHSGPGWDKRYIAEIYEFDAFVRDLTVSDKRLSYRYLHFGFTHFPVDFDRHCSYRSDDPQWFSTNQNSVGLANETMCAFAKLSEFLLKLKELGIYDNSLVVFKSDHGHPTNYFAKYPYNLEINEHALWGYSRYRPTLMIKPAQTRQDKLKIQQDLALLGDLAKTICRYTNDIDSRPNCEIFPGMDLLAAADDDTGYYLYVVPTATSSFTFDAHISAPVGSRRDNPVEALSATGGVAIRERAASPD
jgi:hypothetical protein